MLAPQQPHAVISYRCLRPFSFVHVSSFFLFLWKFLFFPVFLYHYRLSVKYGEHVVLFFLPDDVFPPCDHGMDFVRIQSIRIIIVGYSV